MATELIAICSNPDCARHAAAGSAAGLPVMCPTCGAPMVTRCWKCDTPIDDPFSSYCARCGVPLKRVLPRTALRPPVLVLCGNPECDWAAEVQQSAARPSRCPRCGAPAVSHCWKCGARVVDLHQHYCQACGVPLKRQRRPA